MIESTLDDENNDLDAFLKKPGNIGLDSNFLEFPLSV